MNLAKTYTPNDYEPSIYALWERSGGFAPSGQGEKFSIVMPPPNANANLHIGHALDMNLKDILARYYRMRGRDVAFIPGADHAGFETWVVYEKHLQAEGKSRFDFSREELYTQAWDFVEARRGDMELQLRALGTSASWGDMVFTLDKKVIDTVYQTFKQMWDDGLVYRGERIVNYCTVHQTSFADIEVEHREEKSKLWHIAYPTLDAVGEVVVATTRPETMLGDTAVAVHPEDERYKHLVGTRVQLPLTDREIEIIADDHVDPEFGTGVVKVTPAHDPNDFAIAERHKLEVRKIIDYKGKMINVPSGYAGLSIEEARKRVVAALQAEEHLRKTEDLVHAVGHCYKCGTVIEPLVMDQWFVKVRPLAEAAITRLEQGEIEFLPSSKQKEIITYLSQLKDWNISRQIPWGIPIPAFVNVNDPEDWIFDERVNQAEIVVDGTTYKREEDTFDTWFSSGQWPYVVTDLLTDGPLSRFYPTDFMETGSDLLRQWVSRMIMLGVYRTGQVPFKTVYMHGMVTDEKGQKMSKSKGNVINPMDMVSEFGSDALRMGIIAGRSPAQAQAFNRGAVIAGRNFCNKLWNMARYITGIVGEYNEVPAANPDSMIDHWILSRLDQARQTVDQHLAEYRYSEAADAVYHVIWDDVADWYLEASKVERNEDMLVYVLDTCLRLAHPFAPFVTETIWQAVSWHSDATDIAMTAAWPDKIDYEEISAAQFERLKRLVIEARFVTSELPGNEKYTMLYMDDSLVQDNAELIGKLAGLKSVEHVDQARGLRLASSGRDAWLDVSEKVLYEHQGNLEVRLAETRATIANLQARLDNPNYVDKAPEHLVAETRQDLERKQAHEERLVRELEVL